jgi:hypothetical protein
VPQDQRTPRKEQAVTFTVGGSASSTGLHVVYRSYGGENTKGRPGYYSKLLALSSLVRTVASVRRPVEVIFLNDGPIPADRLDVMRRAGEVVPLPGVGNKRSLLAALALPARRSWPGRDVVWFAEDDYLYRPDALDRLIRAADAVADADYFGLYALIGDRPPEGGRAPSWLDVPVDRRPTQQTTIDGHEWRAAMATTATFGARVGVIRADRHVFALSLATSSTWDYTASLAYQGIVPFPLRRLAAEPRPIPASVGRRARTLAAVPARAAVDLVTIRQRRRRRLLLAADPALCTHLETEHLAAGSDWPGIAADTADWARTEIGPTHR